MSYCNMNAALTHLSCVHMLAVDIKRLSDYMDTIMYEAQIIKKSC